MEFPDNKEKDYKILNNVFQAPTIAFVEDLPQLLQTFLRNRTHSSSFCGIVTLFLVISVARGGWSG
jgi:hypothetical protein